MVAGDDVITILLNFSIVTSHCLIALLNFFEVGVCKKEEKEFKFNQTTHLSNKK